jgi:cytochrome c-type biogenesis protein CcmH
MTGFFIVAAILLLAGVGALLWPLLRGSPASPKRQAAAVVALFRDKLRELDTERASGALDAVQYDQSRRELERGLLDAVAGAEPAPAGPQRARWSAALIGLFVLIAPVVLYSMLGTPQALLPGMETDAASAGAQASGAGAAAGKGGARPLTSAQVQKMIDGLVENLKRSPGDAEGWAMLARAYAYERQYSDAVRAYTKAVAIKPRDARLLADLADALAMTNGQRLDGEPLKLIERALEIDPKDIKALALAGTAAFDHQQYPKAVAYWERALAAAPNDPEFAQTLRSSLDEARQLAGGKAAAGGGGSTADLIANAASGGGASAASAAAPVAAGAGKAAAGGSVRGKVVLAANLAAKAAPGDTVFVFARAAQGPRVPLALVRRQVKDLPFEFSLDDSMAMMPDFTLSRYSPVIVGARISKTGDAIAAAGDLQGFSKPVGLGAMVNVTIDQVVP